MPSRHDQIPQRTDAEIATLSEVTDDAVDEAARYWREHAAGKFKGLVDAEETKSTEGE